MLSANDLVTVYDFVKSTGEANVRKMMTGPKMTNTHINLLFKVIRHSTSEEFAKHYEGSSFPRMKTNNDEDKVKDKFWATAGDCFLQLGFASTSKAA